MIQPQIDEAESIAEVSLPGFIQEDGRKARYLKYRISGFTIRESTNLAGISESIVRHWREHDPEFREIDTTDKVKDLREKLGSQYLAIEFTRNFHLAMQKDFLVLYRSIKEPDKLSSGEQQYLLKLRNFYTPQQLVLMKQLIGEANADGFDFTRLVFEIKREREEITVTGEK